MLQDTEGVSLKVQQEPRVQQPVPVPAVELEQQDDVSYYQKMQEQNQIVKEKLRKQKELDEAQVRPCFLKYSTRF